jgi:hypothetical protein
MSQRTFRAVALAQIVRSVGRWIVVLCRTRSRRDPCAAGVVRGIGLLAVGFHFANSQKLKCAATKRRNFLNLADDERGMQKQSLRRYRKAKYGKRAKIAQRTLDLHAVEVRVDQRQMAVLLKFVALTRARR